MFLECVEYERHAYRRAQIVTIAGQPPPIERVCAHISVPLIVGGERAKPKEFAHMVRLLLHTRVCDNHDGDVVFRL